ncbi:hypothetical protein PC9H_009867 [Pleurotus ostreatus]|uniref:AAA+ ATPase domain-containing protein n=1 Tax=Pleurotus ostreatus TaxID=5322 RepID=A0A8H6ZMH9_PLEOS|nr:uncharacterized protein PC9H_009867 [Pleurotus ostreatus]KAF7424560.1 hypothetical protein PC9H_009867 [Pleurotus ostreatus]
MEVPVASNALNKSMQSLWSNHRRAKLNLNSPAQSGSATPTPVETPASEEAVTQAQEVSVTPSTVEPPVSPPPASSVKRKIRSSRTAVESNKRSKTATSDPKDRSPPLARLSDLGGVESCIEKMLELVAMPLCHPEVYLHTGVQPPRGVLLHGPPGCGKTLLAHAMAGELGIPFINISAPSIVSGMSGESEKALRDTFEEAKASPARVAPCLLFIDEIDAITPKRESAQREMERRIVAQFLTCMDDMSWDKTENKPVIVMGATNRPDSLDPALRRAGRFDHEISMGVPDEEAREKILRVLCARLRMEGSFDFKSLAKATPGYVGADLSALTGAAGIIAVKRIFKELSEGTLVLPPPEDGDISMAVDSLNPPDSSPVPAPFASLLSMLPGTSLAHFLTTHPSPLTDAQLLPLTITSSDFQHALTEIQPSSKREGFATVPDVTWDDIGALHSIREELHMAIVQPIKRPEVFRMVGITTPCGVLLWGPPGCGKTLLAKAVANESRANFISVKGPELLNKYVGESERAVRQVFSRARASSPCVIFFDELDALVPRRDDSLSESSARVVNTLLTELDGLDARKSVYVIAATNRPDMIDPAMVRPGRLDKLLYVDLPTDAERTEIIRTLLRTVPLGIVGQARTDQAKQQTMDEVESLARERCDGYSGADLASLVREAGVSALKRTLGSLDRMDDEGHGASAGGIIVGTDDFSQALGKIGPSVSIDQRKRYIALKNKFAGLPVRSSRSTGDLGVAS